MSGTGIRLLLVSLMTFGSATDIAADTTRHGKVGQYLVLENHGAFMALTRATQSDGGAFSFGCAKKRDVCGHLLHFPDAVQVPDGVEHVVFMVDGGAIHIIGAMAYGKGRRGSSLVLSDLALEESSTFADGREITFWPGVVSGAMPGGDGSRTFSLAGYRESVRAVRAMKASFLAGDALPALDEVLPSGAEDEDSVERTLRRAIRSAPSKSQ